MNDTAARIKVQYPQPALRLWFELVNTSAAWDFRLEDIRFKVEYWEPYVGWVFFADTAREYVDFPVMDGARVKVTAYSEQCRCEYEKEIIIEL